MGRRVILHFNCPPISGNPADRPLVFTWDPEAGTVTGPDAAQVRELAKPGAILDGHPRPRTLRLGMDPLKSRRDMAVVVGTNWQVPEELLPSYPFGTSDRNVYDEAGNVIDQVMNHQLPSA